MGGERYRAAIVGTGRIATLLERDPLRGKPCTHAGHYGAHSRIELSAGCDVDHERLAAFGADWAIAPAHLYGDYRTMLERERPDIVSVCAYAPERLAMCRAAVETGARGLWIEKAVACSVDEGRELERLVAASGVAAVVDHPRRAETRYRAVARWIREQRLGRLESVHVVFSGHLIHTGTHAWDVLLDWCGPWASVSASLDAADRGGDGRADRWPMSDGRAADAAADRGGRAHILFENGIEAFVTGGAKDYFVFQFDLVFSAGRVRIGNDVWEVLTPAASPRYSGFDELACVAADTLVEAGDRYPTPMLEDLVRCMEDGERPLQSLASAVEALALGVACVEAGLLGRAVEPHTLSLFQRVESR